MGSRGLLESSQRVTQPPTTATQLRAAPPAPACVHSVARVQACVRVCGCCSKCGASPPGPPNNPVLTRCQSRSHAHSITMQIALLVPSLAQGDNNSSLCARSVVDFAPVCRNIHTISTYNQAMYCVALTTTCGIYFGLQDFKMPVPSCLQTVLRQTRSARLMFPLGMTFHDG